MLEVTPRPLGRRTVLAGMGAGALAVLLVGRQRASSATRIGDLEVQLPAGLTVQPGARYGVGWQWAAAHGDALTVAARADLDSTSPSEILGVLLAGAVVGGLPGLALGEVAERWMPGGRQTRVELSYGADPRDRRHGALSILTRAVPPAGVVVVVGDETLTAGTIDAVLDSVRWSR